MNCNVDHVDKAVAWMMYSKHLTAWFAAVALLSSAAVSKQTPHNTTAVSEEPFRSFRMLDAKLTLLTKQQDALGRQHLVGPANTSGNVHNS
jgi:hypothetical protein